MARAIRIDFLGALHHVIIKGNRGGDIFYNAKDREKFLSRLSLLIKRYDFTLYAYCLMDNHVHLLIETGSTPLSKLMGELLTHYVQGFNKKWNKKGHLLGDRYKSILVDKKQYLLVLARYIHLNPVKAKIVALPEEYPWSSYKEYISVPHLVSPSLVLSYFKNVEEFKRFTLEGIKKKKPPLKKVQNYLVYGTKEFMHQTLEKVRKERRRKGRKAKKIKVSDVDNFLKEKYGKQIEDIGNYSKEPLKKVAVALLRERVHLTFKEISRIFKTTPQSIHKLYHASSVMGEKLEEFERWIEKS